MLSDNTFTQVQFLANLTTSDQGTAELNQLEQFPLPTCI